MHWRLDVVFREDENRIRKGFAPAIMTIIRYICINLFQINDAEMSTKRKRNERSFKMNNMMNYTDGWMGGGMWLWPVLGVLLIVLLVVVIINQSKK